MPASVSVVVPTHRGGPLLKEAVMSVVEQTFRDWELVVVDDRSGADLAWIESLDSRARIVPSAGRGVSIARNAGIAATRGPLVAFLDHDDRWYPTKLQVQVDRMSADALFAHTAFDLIDEKGTRTAPGYGGNAGYYGLLAGEPGFQLSSLVVRRSALDTIGVFNPLLRIQQDLDLVLRLLRVGTCTYLDSVQMSYRLHPDNTSRDYWRAAQELLWLYQLHDIDAESHGDTRAREAIIKGRRAMRRTYSYQAIDAARAAAHADERRDAWRALIRACRLSPRPLVSSTRRWLEARMRRVTRQVARE